MISVFPRNPKNGALPRGVKNMMDQNTPKYADEIQLVTSPVDTCLNCGAKLAEGTALLRDEPPKAVPGRVCPACGRYYVAGARGLDNYLATHWYRHRSRTRDSELWTYAREEITARDKEWKQKDKLSKTPGAVLLLELRDDAGKGHDVLLTALRAQEDKTRNILYFGNRTALSLLTYAFHPDFRGKSFTSGGRTCTVAAAVRPDREADAFVIPDTLYLRKGGGVRDPQHPAAPLTAALLYSPFSRHYEGMMVTRDKEKGLYYADPAKFREFVRRCGNPGIRVGFRKANGDYTDRKASPGDFSFLEAYGYVITPRDNLPADARQQILAEIIDLDLASVSGLSAWLSTSAAGARSPEAAACWQADLDFVRNYTPDPARFLSARK